MTRRTFLQSVIAVPLVAVGMPQVSSIEQRIDIAMRGARPIGDAELLAMLPRRYRIVGRGAFGEFERGLSPDTTREWADALARRIDEEALRHALRQVRG